MKDSATCTEWICGDLVSPKFLDYCDSPDYMYCTSDLLPWINPLGAVTRKVVSLFPLSR